MNDDSHYSLDEPQPILMRSLDGDSIVVLVREVTVSPTRIDLSGELPIGAWDDAVAIGAFHIDLEPAALPDEPTSVEVVLALRPALLDRFDDGDQFVNALFGDDALLCQSEAWLLASALRRLPVPGEPDASTASGYRTRWARSPLV